MENKNKILKSENIDDPNIEDEEEIEKNFKEIYFLEFNNKENFFENILENLEKFYDKFLHTKC